ncbi:cysteine desulfurase-like protein [Glaciibacter psychrotolerans]|uniref:Cysteine desulfurase family protein (TIGR01976 family) n=1 Tax=Glaciibacter psychrotolerans TaxID=670054 RepID=A0A7Z0EFS6_9MICO|nr:cysteine desulfurase-like protein [Leifsonia psychrotolerans]NYJ20425.1 cysteine desulfurase family protein (TIGR01976 family) [Leifsonia psychrotolerans]
MPALDAAALTQLRGLFPALNRTAPSGELAAYLDGPGGTQVPESVIEAISDYLRNSNSNIEGEFDLTIATDELLALSRAYGGSFVGGDAGCIAFGQNMTTLNFSLIAAFGRTLKRGDEIVTTALDHDSNVAPWLLLAQDLGLVVHTVGLKEDLTLDLDDLASKLSSRTKVVAFTLASNAVGTLTPAREIARMAHEVGALAWVDAVAFAAHRRIDVVNIGCDVLLCSPYKFFGPHLGMAWVRRDLAETWPANRVRPAGITPPGHRFETGTLAHEALAGFVAAIDYLAALGAGDTLDSQLDSAYQVIEQQEHFLAERFLAGIARVPGVRLVGPRTAESAGRVGTFGLVVEGGGSARLARALGERGIYTWNGSFYAQGVLEHLGIDLDEGLLRAGVVHYNTVADIDRFLRVLTELHADAH